MTNAEAIQAQNGTLIAIHCDLQDGGINEAGQKLFICRKSITAGDDWTAEELEWLASLDSMFDSFNAS